MTEAKRVFLSRRHLGILALLLALNLFLFFWQNSNTSYPQSAYRTAYQSLLEKYQVMSPEEALTDILTRMEEANGVATLQAWSTMEEPMKEAFTESCRRIYGDDFEARWADGTLTLPEDMSEVYLQQAVLSRLQEQVTYLQEYPEYLNTVHANARQMAALSIFSDGGGFSSKNIEKTDADFPQTVEIALDNDFSIESLIHDSLSGYSLLIYIVGLVLLFLQERRRGLWNLIYGSAGGRGALALWRCLILFAGAVLGVFVLSFGKFLIIGAYYGGFGDLTRNIQSISAFRTFPYVMPVWKFLTLFFLYRIFGIWAAGLLLWTILQAVSNLPLAITAAALVFAAEYAAFQWIPDSYKLVFLRFANVFALIDFRRVFLPYLNLNLFGMPVQGHSITLILLPLLTVIFIGACVILQMKKRPIGRENILLRLADRCKRPFTRVTRVLGLRGFEAHKLLIPQKGAIVLLLVALYMGFYQVSPPPDLTMYDADTVYYEIELQGPLTQETLDTISSRIQTLEEDGLTESNIRQIQAYQSLQERYLTAPEGTWVVNPVPYMTLMNLNRDNSQRTSGIILMIAVVLLAAGVFAFEQQSRMWVLAQTSHRGRTLWRKKLFIVLAAVSVLAIVYYGRELMLITEKFGAFGGLQAPIQSLAYFSESNLHLPLWGMLALYIGARLLTLWVLTCLVCALSSSCRTVNAAILLSTVVFVLPAAFSMIGLKIFDKLSLLLPLSPLECSLWIYPLLALLGASAAVFCRWRWTKKTA